MTGRMMTFATALLSLSGGLQAEELAVTRNAVLNQATWAPHVPKLTLVAARNVPGGFLDYHSICSDPLGRYWYGASFEGNFFAISAQPPYALLGGVSMSARPLNGCSATGNRVYVTSGDGEVHWISLSPLSPTPFNTGVLDAAGTNSVSVDNNENMVVSLEDAITAVNGKSIFYYGPNQSDEALVLDKNSLVTRTTVGHGDFFPVATTFVFNRVTGKQVGTIANPTPNQVTFSADDHILTITSPGPQSTGTWLYDANTLQLLVPIKLQYANTAVAANNDKWLFVGTEAGWIYHYDISNPRNPLLLSALYLGSNAECRSIAISPSLLMSPYGNLACGTSWGDPSGVNPALNSFFLAAVE